MRKRPRLGRIAHLAGAVSILSLVFCGTAAATAIKSGAVEISDNSNPGIYRTPAFGIAIRATASEDGGGDAGEGGDSGSDGGSDSDRSGGGARERNGSDRNGKPSKEPKDGEIDGDRRDAPETETQKSKENDNDSAERRLLASHELADDAPQDAAAEITNFEISYSHELGAWSESISLIGGDSAISAEFGLGQLGFIVSYSPISDERSFGLSWAPLGNWSAGTRTGVVIVVAPEPRMFAVVHVGTDGNYDLSVGASVLFLEVSYRAPLSVPEIAADRMVGDALKQVGELAITGGEDPRGDQIGHLEAIEHAIDRSW